MSAKLPATRLKVLYLNTLSALERLQHYALEADDQTALELCRELTLSVGPAYASRDPLTLEDLHLCAFGLGDDLERTLEGRFAPEV